MTDFLQTDSPIRFPKNGVPWEQEVGDGVVESGFTLANGDTFVYQGAEPEITYVFSTKYDFWTGTTAGGSGSGEIISGPNPPANPEIGTLWYNSKNGITYIYFANAGEDKAQWVDVRPGGGGGGSGGDGGGSSGGEISNPKPELITSSPPLSGSGSQSDPFIINPADCFKKGEILSENEITFNNLNENDFVVFTDLNSATNGGAYDQGIGLVPPSGKYTFRFHYQDLKEIGGASYTGDLQCGDVYFRWDVSVLDKGVDRPIIEKVLDIGGELVDAPVEPSYPTKSTVSNAVPTSTLDSLTDGTSTELTASGGSGSGLKLQVIVSDNTWKYTLISDPGSNYVFGETVTVDLSSVGGSASQEFYVHTSPVTSASTTIQASDFVSDNAGSFGYVEWDFSDTEDFSVTFKETSNTSPDSSNTISAKNTKSDGDVYYFRIRYVSDDLTTSAWSKGVRVARGPAVRFAYRLTNLVGSKNKGFQSNDGFVVPVPYSYLSGTVNFAEDGTPFHYETHKNDIIGAPGGRPGPDSDGNAAPDSMYGFPAKAMVYIQIRQPVRVTVDTVSSGKPATMSMHPDYTKKIGLPDFVTEGEEVDPTSNIVGGGSGLTLRFGKDGNGNTIFVGFDAAAASGYSAGDIIEYVPPIGDGSDKSIDSVWDTLVHGVAGTARGNGCR